MSEIEKARAAGIKEGADDATLAAHTEHLRKINGSIDRSADALEALKTEVREGLIRIRDEIRTLQEEARAAVLAVEVSRDVLAKETERRRRELADAGESGARRFTRGQQITALLITLAGFVLAAILAFRDFVTG